MSLKNKIIQSSMIYAFFSILSQVLHILFVKINTNILSVDEYGKYSLLLTTQGMLTVFVSLGINSGLTRFFKEYSDTNNLRNIALSFAFVWSSLILSTCVLFIKPISNLILDDNTSTTYLILIILSTIFTLFIEIYNVSFRMKFLAKKSSLVDISILLINFLLLSVFGIYYKLGILGVLLAYSSARFIIFLYLFFSNLSSFKFHIDRKKLKPMLYYGVGLMMGNASSWILTFIDRFFLKSYYDFETVGVYSIGYKIGQMIRPIYIIPFKKIFSPFIYEVYNQEEGKTKIKKMFRYYNLIGWFIVLGFAIFSKPMIELISKKEYIEAYKIVPWVSISYLIFTLTMFVGFGLHVVNKMFLNSFIMILGAAFNIVLNIYLIPKFGMYGAVASTIVSYIGINIIYYIVGKHYWDTKLNFFYPYWSSIPFLICYMIYLRYISVLNNYFIEIPLSILLSISYVILLLIFRYINFYEIKSIIRYGLNKVKKVKK